MATVSADTSAAALLNRFRGQVSKAYVTYADMARIEVTDAEGGRWLFGTWEADYSPADPEALLGKFVTSAEVDGRSGVLTVGFADGSAFTVAPVLDEDDDVEHWELFTPEDAVLVQGPIGRWKLRSAGGPRGHGRIG